MFGLCGPLQFISAFVAMHTQHILKELKLSKKPPIVRAPKLSAENGPMDALKVCSLPSTSNDKQFSRLIKKIYRCLKKSRANFVCCQ